MSWRARRLRAVADDESGRGSRRRGLPFCARSSELWNSVACWRPPRPANPRGRRARLTGGAPARVKCSFRRFRCSPHEPFPDHRHHRRHEGRAPGRARRRGGPRERGRPRSSPPTSSRRKRSTSWRSTAAGLICMPITAAHAARLNLAPMVPQNRSVHGTNFTVSIEAAHGVTTGISAADRAHTIRVAARAGREAVRHRAAGPRVSADRAAGRRAGARRAHRGLLRPRRARRAHAGGRAVRDHECRRHDGAAARSRDVRAPSMACKIGAIADLIQHRSRTERLVERIAERPLAHRARRVPPGRLSRQALRRDASRARSRAGVARTPRRWCACTSRCR